MPPSRTYQTEPTIMIFHGFSRIKFDLTATEVFDSFEAAID
jgi:hypothetical protein